MGAHSAPSRNRAVKALFSVAILAASSFTLTRATADAATPFRTVQPGTFTGYAFDACTAPSSATMKAWKAASPYRAIGIYIGGNNRGCTQANLTAAWVKEQVTAGWKLLPLYVGPQATCITATKKKNYIDNANADTQGRNTAVDAVAKANALGLAAQSVIIYDMEAYRTDDAACRRGVLAFMNGWTSRLHDLGYLSGFYSSVSSGVADQVANYSAAGYARPDYLDFARWDQVVTTDDAGVPAGDWAPHRRMKQYRGGHQETWGGVTINIDNDYVDFAMLPAAKTADFTGNGWSDLLARSSANGNLYLYPGNGSILSAGARRSFGGGWNAMNAIVRIGDLNKDGKEDVVARQTNGDLWFYPGTGTALGSRKKIGTGWGARREIAGVGDLNKDGYPDLVAIDSSSNILYLYPGKSGTKLGSRVPISGGWGNFRDLAGLGDYNRDGFPDLAARDSTTGILHAYLGSKGAIKRRMQIGTGWNAMRDITGVGDFDRDGFVDVIAARNSDSSLLLYRGTSAALRAGTRLTTLSGYAPLL